MQKVAEYQVEKAKYKDRERIEKKKIKELKRKIEAYQEILNSSTTLKKEKVLRARIAKLQTEMSSVYSHIMALREKQVEIVEKMAEHKAKAAEYYEKYEMYEEEASRFLKSAETLQKRS